MLPLALAFGASVAWGASDFLGGMASRRRAVAAVLFWAQLTGLALAAAVWLAAGGELPSASVAGLAAVAGLAELVGFALLFRGLAVGEMSAVAPLAALTAVLPVCVAVGTGQRLAALEAAGMVLAMLGSAATAAEPGTRRLARGAALGLAASVAFGVFLLALGEAGAGGGAGAVLCGRLASVAALAVVLAVRCRRVPQGTPGGRELGLLAALGALDVLANLAYSGAAAAGENATVAVLGSLYPLTTVLLARALLRERLGRARSAGVAAVLGGVALISLAA